MLKLLPEAVLDADTSYTWCKLLSTGDQNIRQTLLRNFALN